MTLTVQGQYEDAFSLSGTKTYLFTEAGTYQGLSITTDANGQAVYSLPEQAYKLRADHLGVKYWSEPATWEDRTITVDHGAVNVTVAQAGTALAGARVYVFSSSGSYLGLSAATDSAGAASLTLPVNTYKLRIDYNGGKYWTEEIDLIQGQAVDAAYDLDTLALNLTANPHYARYDGKMPQKEEPSVLLASIGSLAGYDATPSQPETVYYINNHLGTPLKVIDNDNQVLWDGAYLPFGLVEDSAEGVQNLLRFPGQYFDAETGLHYNWHRYYDPETGRYLTPDPIGLDGGINPFVYSLNNPVNYFDPEGLNPLGIRFGEGIPGLDEDGRAFERVVTQKMTRTFEYMGCVIECTIPVGLGEYGTQQAQKAAIKAAKKANKKWLLKGIPGVGNLSTAYSVYQGIECFAKCSDPGKGCNKK